MSNAEPDYSEHRFLIVDDKPFIRTIVQSMLLRCNAREIRNASDGASAMATLTEASGDIDCVLCDWAMEPMNGLQLLRAIRTGAVARTARDLRFIMLTGHADKILVQAAVMLDTSGFVAKPVSLVKLSHAIDSAMAKPVPLKSIEAYLAKPMPNLHVVTEQPTKVLSASVLRSEMNARAAHTISKHVDHIRQEAAKIRAQTQPVKRRVINGERIDLDQITAGKVLAEDLFAADGMLLLAAGVALSTSIIGRLRDLAAVNASSGQLMVGDYGD